MSIGDLRLFCLLTVLFVSACESPEAKDTLTENGPFVYPIDLGAASVDFLDQVESISVFGFEESEESLLEISSLFIDYENGLIVVNESSGDVFVFDGEGSFVSKFNRKGGGPEEYDEMAYTVYRNGFIETYNYSKKRLVRYDLQGKYLGETKLPYQATYVLFDKDRYLVSMGGSSAFDSAKYNLRFMDVDGNEYGKALPFDTEIPFGIVSPINAFSALDDQILFNELLSDSIVLIGESDVTSYVKFDFDDQWFWTEDMYARGNESMGLINTANKVWIYNWAMGKDRIELSYNTSFQDYRRGFINRSTGEFRHYDYPSWGEEIPSIRSVRFEGGLLVTTMLSDVLDAFIDKLGEGRYSIESGQTLDELLQSENPIIVKIKFY